MTDFTITEDFPKSKIEFDYRFSKPAACYANKATLIDILTYHVFNGSVLSPAAIALDGQSVTMLNGGSMAIDVAASELVLNLGGNRQATVTIKDVLCSNGVIHVIDAVLDPVDGVHLHSP